MEFKWNSLGVYLASSLQSDLIGKSLAVATLSANKCVRSTGLRLTEVTGKQEKSVKFEEIEALVH